MAGGAQRVRRQDTARSRLSAPDAESSDGRALASDAEGHTHASVVNVVFNSLIADVVQLTALEGRQQPPLQ